MYTRHSPKRSICLTWELFTFALNWETLTVSSHPSSPKLLWRLDTSVSTNKICIAGFLRLAESIISLRTSLPLLLCDLNNWNRFWFSWTILNGWVPLIKFSLLHIYPPPHLPPDFPPCHVSFNCIAASQCWVAWLAHICDKFIHFLW